MKRYIKSNDDFSDMIPENVKIRFCNYRRVPFAPSNFLYKHMGAKQSMGEFIDTYLAGREWSAESIAQALNDAYKDKYVIKGPWSPHKTAPTKISAKLTKDGKDLYYAFVYRRED